MRLPLLLLTAMLLGACAGEPVKPELSAEEKAQKAAPMVHDADREFAVGRYSTALFYYEQALEYLPEDYRLRLRVADSHRQLGNFALAKERYQALIGDRGVDIGAREGLGLTQLKLGEQAAARELFVAVLEDDAERWRSLNALGTIEDLHANYSAAGDYYRRALQAEPNNPIIINNYGYSLIMAGDYAAAERELKRGIAHAPDFFRLRNNLAIAHAWQGEYREAVDVLIVTLPHEVAYNNIGYIAMLSGDYENARFYLKKAISISPRHYLQAVRNLEKLEQAMSDQRQGESFSAE